jgi:TolB-like protein/DNA-binding winged helix-turn-helix (wHTH) protein/Tfp pilus assembly protein PilF
VRHDSASADSSATVIRFADFEVDLRAVEMRQRGIKVKLQNQPFQILQMLLERPGEIVTREEIRSRIWPADTFVDFEHSVNTAIKKLRQALGDRAENPVFIETLPRQGFRFIATIDELPKTVPAPAQIPYPQPRNNRKYVMAGALTLAVAAGFILPRIDSFSPGGFSPNTMRSIAVLPLVNLSSDPNEEYFSEGMTSELITDLARFSKLQVISHTSVKRYKDTKRPLPEIARELGVDAVIEGTVMRSGNRARISVQLIDARSDRHVWANSYDRDVRDVLSLQAELAQNIATEAGVHLTASEQARLAKKLAVDPAAHEALLKGDFFGNRWTCTGFRQALEYYQQALNKDPSYVLAYAGIGDSYFNLADMGCMPQQEGFSKSKQYAAKSVQLDPDLPDAHTTLGSIAFYYEWDWARTEKELQQAIALDPNDGGAHSEFAIYLTARGRPADGLAEMRKAQQLDPVSQVSNITSTYVFYLAHQFDQAIAAAKRILELYPQSGAAYYWLGQCYEQQGKEQEALAAYRHASTGSELQGSPPQSLQEFWQRRSARQRASKLDACLQMQNSAHLGNRETTLDRLEWGFQHHCDGLQFLKAEPIYDNLRDDARYTKLISRLGL